MTKKILTLAAIGALVTSSAFAAPMELITNGDFETGNYSGWNPNVRPGSSGNLNISTPGANAPLSGSSTAANPFGGFFYSVTDQIGPGSYALTQSFAVPLGTTSVQFSFQMFANTYGGTIIDPIGLDHNGNSNEHARVDILLASTADPFSTAVGDIVGNYYLGTDNSSTNPNPYTNYLFNLTGVLTGGQSYILRFGQVDNRGFFNQGVDNVSILADGNVVPEPGSLALVLLGFGLVAAGLQRRSKS